MLTIIKNADIYTPEHIGLNDIAISGGKIISVAKSIQIQGQGLDMTIVDLEGKRLIPGLIDAHVHICGGGGEGGYKTRTPELRLSDMVSAGVTTVVGCLGTDGVARSVENLVAKAKGLKEEGVSAYCYTGSYSLPLTTLTGDIRKDIMMVEEIVGIGEVAISDHRSSAPGVLELAKVVSESRLGGILSGKSGVVNMHLGDGKQLLDPIYEVMKNSNIPVTQFLPTHINRNHDLFEAGIRHAQNGGYIDITTSTTPLFIEYGEVAAPEALKRLLEAGVSFENVTMTSDGQGSLPSFDEEGVLNGLTVGSQLSLFDAVYNAYTHHEVPLEEGLRTITSSPASILKLSGKGHIDAGMDADIVVLDQSGRIDSVMALGRWMMQDGEVIVKGTFE